VSLSLLNHLAEAPQARERSRSPGNRSRAWRRLLESGWEDIFMRNIVLSGVVIVAIVACLGYGASQLTQEMAELKSQISELKQTQGNFKGQIAELRKTYEDLDGRLTAIKARDTEGGVAGDVRTLKDQVAQLREEVTLLRSVPSSSDKPRVAVDPEQIAARKQRCQFVEEYLTKLEQIYGTKDAEERTEKRIQADQEFKNTRDFILNTLGKRWMESYEDALQAAYFIDDPARNVAGQAKIKPLLSKLLKRCMEAGLE
jgi:hypothetical protein